MIRLNVLVLDPGNAPVLDVKQEDFRILEDGVTQTISYFSTDERPLNYCVLTDSSGSVGPWLKHVIDAAQSIVSTNKPGDETSLIEFKDQPELLVEFTTSKHEIIQRLELLRGAASRQSAVRDGIYLAAEHADQYKPVDRLSRRVVIVFSDGIDNGSYYKLEDLRKRLRRMAVQVFSIGYPSEVLKSKSGKEQQRAIELLTEIAKETGGRAYFPQTTAELHYLASQIPQMLRTQYVLGYEPSRQIKKDSYHTVSVSVVDLPGRDKRSVITRSGYTDVE